MKKLTWILLALTSNVFSQAAGNGFTDIDGNQYNTVIIGTQEWMKENLNVTKYSDGTPIPQVTDPTVLAGLTKGAWCYYNNDSTLGNTYGKMYNWYAVAGIHDNDSTTPNKSLAPSDWQVPSANDWSTLINYLGGSSIAGGKMKDTSLVHWLSPNTDATNSSGFTGLPGGYRASASIGQNLTGTGHWWCSDYLAPFSAKGFQLSWINGSVDTNIFSSKVAISVRFIQNSTTGNKTIINQLFEIYPNPANDQLTIDLTNNSNLVGLNYKIANTFGQEVLVGLLNSQQNIIHLNNIKGQGMYFVKIYDHSNNLIHTKKISIQQ
jgi:uncharacterized protein (TIGR02145 family)